MVEESHSTLGDLLRTAVDRAGKGRSFKGLISEAQGRGLIGEAHADMALRLNARRRKLKHQGQAVPVDEVPYLIWKTAELCQVLTASFRKY